MRSQYKIGTELFPNTPSRVAPIWPGNRIVLIYLTISFIVAACQAPPLCCEAAHQRKPIAQNHYAECTQWPENPNTNLSK